MSNAEFRSNFAALLKKAGDNAGEVARQAAITLQNHMIMKSPVDTGRFKGNWQCGIGSIDSSESDREDKTPLGTYDPLVASLATQNTLKGWKLGQTIHLTNSLPYARRLEYDSWSQQAPGGMVRLTVQAYSDLLKKVVAEVAQT